MDFFGIGLPELVLVLLILLLFFGKDKLPELSRSIGQSVKELKDGFSATASPSEKDKAMKKDDDSKKSSK